MNRNQKRTNKILKNLKKINKETRTKDAVVPDFSKTSSIWQMVNKITKANNKTTKNFSKIY